MIFLNFCKHSCLFQISEDIFCEDIWEKRFLLRRNYQWDLLCLCGAITWNAEFARIALFPQRWNCGCKKRRWCFYYFYPPMLLPVMAHIRAVWLVHAANHRPIRDEHLGCGANPPNTGSQGGLTDRQAKGWCWSLKPFCRSTWDRPTLPSNWTRIPPRKAEIRSAIKKEFYFFVFLFELEGICCARFKSRVTLMSFQFCN